MRILICLLIIVSLHLDVTARALANESALSVSPAIFEAVVDTTAPTLKVVAVTNTTSFPLPVKGQAGRFLATEDLPASQARQFDASSWFTLSPADFILQPQQTQVVEIAIVPPQDAEPGGHYATVFFTPLIPEGVVSPGSSVSLARVGVLAFLIAPGDLVPSLTLDSLSAPFFSRRGPVAFSLTFDNSGTVHLSPTGSLQLTNWRGQQVGTLSLPPTIILPGTKRHLDLTWEPTWLLGRYRATAMVTYGDGLPVEPLTYQFWVVPWPLLLGVIVGLTIVYKLFIVGHKRVKLALKVLRTGTL